MARGSASNVTESRTRAKRGIPTKDSEENNSTDSTDKKARTSRQKNVNSVSGSKVDKKGAIKKLETTNLEDESCGSNSSESVEGKGESEQVDKKETTKRKQKTGNSKLDNKIERVGRKRKAEKSNDEVKEETVKELENIKVEKSIVKEPNKKKVKADTVDDNSQDSIKVTTSCSTRKTRNAKKSEENINVENKDEGKDLEEKSKDMEIEEEIDQNKKEMKIVNVDENSQDSIKVTRSGPTRKTRNARKCEDNIVEHKDEEKIKDMEVEKETIPNKEEVYETSQDSIKITRSASTRKTRNTKKLEENIVEQRNEEKNKDMEAGKEIDHNEKEVKTDDADDNSQESIKLARSGPTRMTRNAKKAQGYIMETVEAKDLEQRDIDVKEEIDHKSIKVLKKNVESRSTTDETINKNFQSIVCTTKNLKKVEEKSVNGSDQILEHADPVIKSSEHIVATDFKTELEEVDDSKKDVELTKKGIDKKTVTKRGRNKNVDTFSRKTRNMKTIEDNSMDSVIEQIDEDTDVNEKEFSEGTDKFELGEGTSNKKMKDSKENKNDIESKTSKKSEEKDTNTAFRRTRNAKRAEDDIGVPDGQNAVIQNEDSDCLNKNSNNQSQKETEVEKFEVPYRETKRNAETITEETDQNARKTRNKKKFESNFSAEKSKENEDVQKKDGDKLESISTKGEVGKSVRKLGTSLRKTRNAKRVEDFDIDIAEKQDDDIIEECENSGSKSGYGKEEVENSDSKSEAVKEELKNSGLESEVEKEKVSYSEQTSGSDKLVDAAEIGLPKTRSTNITEHINLAEVFKSENLEVENKEDGKDKFKEEDASEKLIKVKVTVKPILSRKTRSSEKEKSQTKLSEDVETEEIMSFSGVNEGDENKDLKEQNEESRNEFNESEAGEIRAIVTASSSTDFVIAENMENRQSMCSTNNQGKIQTSEIRNDESTHMNVETKEIDTYFMISDSSKGVSENSMNFSESVNFKNELRHMKLGCAVKTGDIENSDNVKNDEQLSDNVNIEEQVSKLADTDIESKGNLEVNDPSLGDVLGFVKMDTISSEICVEKKKIEHRYTDKDEQQIQFGDGSKSSGIIVTSKDSIENNNIGKENSGVQGLEEVAKKSSQIEIACYVSKKINETTSIKNLTEKETSSKHDIEELEKNNENKYDQLHIAKIQEEFEADKISKEKSENIKNLAEIMETEIVIATNESENNTVSEFGKLQKLEIMDVEEKNLEESTEIGKCENQGTYKGSESVSVQESVNTIKNFEGISKTAELENVSKKVFKNIPTLDSEDTISLNIQNENLHTVAVGKQFKEDNLQTINDGDVNFQTDKDVLGNVLEENNTYKVTQNNRDCEGTNLSVETKEIDYVEEQNNSVEETISNSPSINTGIVSENNDEIEIDCKSALAPCTEVTENIISETAQGYKILQVTEEKVNSKLGKICIDNATIEEASIVNYWEECRDKTEENIEIKSSLNVINKNATVSSTIGNTSEELDTNNENESPMNRINENSTKNDTDHAIPNNISEELETKKTEIESSVNEIKGNNTENVTVCATISNTSEELSLKSIEVVSEDKIQTNLSMNSDIELSVKTISEDIQSVSCSRIIGASSEEFGNVEVESLIKDTTKNDLKTLQILETDGVEDKNVMIRKTETLSELKHTIKDSSYDADKNCKNISQDAFDSLDTGEDISKSIADIDKIVKDGTESREDIEKFNTKEASESIVDSDRSKEILYEASEPRTDNTEKSYINVNKSETKVDIKSTVNQNSEASDCELNNVVTHTYFKEQESNSDSIHSLSEISCQTGDMLEQKEKADVHSQMEESSIFSPENKIDIDSRDQSFESLKDKGTLAISSHETSNSEMVSKNKSSKKEKLSKCVKKEGSPKKPTTLEKHCKKDERSKKIITTYEVSNNFDGDNKGLKRNHNETNPSKDGNDTKTEVSLALKIKRKRVEEKELCDDAPSCSYEQAIPDVSKSDETKLRVQFEQSSMNQCLVPGPSGINSPSKRSIRKRKREEVESERQRHEISAAPIRSYLEKFVPFLLEGLLKITYVRPDDPIQYLAEWMKENKEAAYSSMNNGDSSDD